MFTVGGTMYMHLMRGVIYRTDHSDFWRSTDNGQTWEYLCQWPGDQYNGRFQQKSYAVAGDGRCYVLSTVFNRDVVSDLLLHRVPQDQLGNPSAYEPWGYANGAWAWGNPPTTVTGSRKWGEICFRAMGGKYAFTWLNLDALSIRAQVFALPTSNLFATPEQTIIVPTVPGAEAGNAVASPYGGFIFPARPSPTSTWRSASGSTTRTTASCGTASPAWPPRSARNRQSYYMNIDVRGEQWCSQTTWK